MRDNRRKRGVGQIVARELEPRLTVSAIQQTFRTSTLTFIDASRGFDDMLEIGHAVLSTPDRNSARPVYWTICNRRVGHLCALPQ